MVNSPFLFKLKSLWSTNKFKSSKKDFLLQIKWFLVLIEMYDYTENRWSILLLLQAETEL